MSLKGINGRDAGKSHAERFRAYLKERAASGTLPWGASGRLHRKVLAQELGWNRDVFRTNPVVRALLAEVEGNPRHRTDVMEADGRAAGERTPKEAELQSRVNELQARLALVEEENRHLKEELRRMGYTHLQLPRSGRLPW